MSDRQPASPRLQFQVFKDQTTNVDWHTKGADGRPLELPLSPLL